MHKITNIGNRPAVPLEQAGLNSHHDAPELFGGSEMVLAYAMASAIAFVGLVIIAIWWVML